MSPYRLNMQEFIIQENEAGQRLDRFLGKYLKEASSGFIFKMLRKKNITLNGRKAEGCERLCLGDHVRFFFSDETFFKFRGEKGEKGTDLSLESYQAAYEKWKDITVIYENDHVILLNKPAGILSQKGSSGDLSLNEWLIGYLLETAQITPLQLETFHPSVCNRLDRNTSGLVICGKSLEGSRTMNKLIRSRSIRKFYRTLVKGNLDKEERAKGYLKKDIKTNQVEFVEYGMDPGVGFDAIETHYKPLYHRNGCTCLEVELITGKTHQIRAHLSGLGHPLLGDPKYGDPEWNRSFRSVTKGRQVLHAFRLEFPLMEPPFEDLSGRVFCAPLPELLKCKGEE